jgi:F420-non-reducing hydrogenase small subunit
VSDSNLIGQVYDQGTVIYRQGDPGDALYLIQSGAVEYAYRQGEAETVLTVLGTGDFFGEMALFGQARRPATARAVQRTRLLPLTRASLLQRMQRDPSVAVHLLKGLYTRIQRGDRHLQQSVETNENLRQALAEGEEGAWGADYAGEQAEGPVAEASLNELAALWDVEQASIDFEPEQEIYRQGDAPQAIYIVLDGCVEVGSGTGTQRTVLFRFTPGDFFGEAEILTERPRSFSATAVARTRVIPIPLDDFLERIRDRPELALYMLEVLSLRLQNLSVILASPAQSVQAVRRKWRPMLASRERIKLAIVSLSTCAGCSAVFLDQSGLDQVLEIAEIVYCPMLVDQEHMPEADVALIDGVVRLQEDQEVLQEARSKSHALVAWGTCACYGGIPAQANAYELEDLIQETYGRTSDAYAYYLSGIQGVERATYQQKGLTLLRKASAADDVCRVDFYLPGCPPNPELLLQLQREVTGQSFTGAKAIVCAECSRRPTKAAVATLEATVEQDDGSTCFHSLGVLCTGVLTKGGCGAVCTRNGLPCWGCRGPAKSALKRMAGGDSYEETVIDRLAQRCRLEQDQVKPVVKRLRRQGHTLFGFEQNVQSSMARIR